MLSGPLAAIIKAQAMAAQSTADFIKSVGLDENNNVVNVDFDYEVLNATTGEKYTNTLTVPLLTIIPIPFIKVPFWGLKQFAWAHVSVCLLIYVRLKSAPLSSTPS
jgi:Protein of unknown function (DUF2589)